MRHTGEFLIHVDFADTTAMPLMIDYTAVDGEITEMTATITYVKPDERSRYKRLESGQWETDCIDVMDVLSEAAKTEIRAAIWADIDNYEPEWEPDDTRAASGTERYMQAAKAKREER